MNQAGVGAKWSWLDWNCQMVGVTFHYWLREVAGADFAEYGPVTARIGGASNGVFLYLPLIMGD